MCSQALLGAFKPLGGSFNVNCCGNEVRYHRRRASLHKVTGAPLPRMAYEFCWFKQSLPWPLVHFCTTPRS